MRPSEYAVQDHGDARGISTASGAGCGDAASMRLFGVIPKIAVALGKNHADGHNGGLGPAPEMAPEDGAGHNGGDGQAAGQMAHQTSWQDSPVCGRCRPFGHNVRRVHEKTGWTAGRTCQCRPRCAGWQGPCPCRGNSWAAPRQAGHHHGHEDGQPSTSSTKNRTPQMANMPLPSSPVS